MIATTAGQIAQVMGGELFGDELTQVHGGAQVDSRQIAGGDIFFALPGEHVDGHDFAHKAVGQGASLIVAQRKIADIPNLVVVDDSIAALGKLARWNVDALRAQGLVTIGITGSVGKTTVKDLIADLLSTIGPTVAPIRSFNNIVGVPLTALRADESTKFLIAEMGTDHPGDIDRVTAIVPLDHAVVLKVGSGHLEGFGGSLDAVAVEKARILAGLVPGGHAVLNAQDGRVAAMVENLEKDATGQSAQPVSWFSEESAGELVISNSVLDAGGKMRFTLTNNSDEDTREHSVELGLVGAHHLINASAASAVAADIGVPAEVIADVLTQHRATSPHRMHVVEGNGITVIDDSYNANPDSMRAALQALATIGRGKRTIAVLGAMNELGEASIDEHDRVGRLAVRLNISKVLSVGAQAYAIHTGAYQEGSWNSESEPMTDREDAFNWLTTNLTQGDVVLIKASNSTGLHLMADDLLEWITS